MTMVLRGCTAAISILMALMVSSADGGDIVKFVDESGTLHFTDQGVPGRYQVYMKDADRKRLGGQSKVSRFSKEIIKAGNRHGVDHHLIRSVIQAESDYDPMAVSRAGARGLMQLMPETAAQYRVNNLHNPAQNIDGGTRHLKRLMNKYGGNVKVALAAYNAGENVVADYNGIPPYAETKTYVKRVMELYKEFSGKDFEVTKKPAVYRYVDDNGTLILTDTPMRMPVQR